MRGTGQHVLELGGRSYCGSVRGRRGAVEWGEVERSVSRV